MIVRFIMPIGNERKITYPVRYAKKWGRPPHRPTAIGMPKKKIQILIPTQTDRNRNKDGCPRPTASGIAEKIEMLLLEKERAYKKEMEFNMKEVLQREMEKYTTNVVKEAVKALSKEYGFKAEEALEKMNLQEVRLGMKEKVEKVKKTDGAPPPTIPLPFTGEIKEEWCKAMKQNHGLYSQCTSTPIPEGELCKTCQNQADKKGKPTCGYIRERQVGNLMEYKDEKGKKVQHYGVVLKKLNIAQADAEAEATKYGMVIPAEQYDIPEKSRGRPKKDQEGGDEADKKRGRPKKEKKVVSGSAADDIVAKLISEANKTKSANAADTLLANLVAAAQAVQASAPAEAEAEAEAEAPTPQAPQAVEETESQKCDCGDSECDDSECEDEEKLAEQAEQEKLAQAAEQEKLAEQAAQEKIAAESKKAQQEAEKKEKKAQQEAEKKEKAEQAKVAKKAQQEQEKAEKKAQQEQEKAAKKALQEQEKAAKKALQEQEKAAKKALQEQEKAAKKALNGGKGTEGTAPPQEAEKKEKAEKKALNGGKAAAPAKKAPEPTPEPTPELEHEEEDTEGTAPPEEEANISVKKFEFEGRVYLRSGDDVLYDIKTEEPVGMWNAEENCIDEIEEDEE